MPPTFVLPGLIDCHVHLREPGLTEKGDMMSETRAARGGGVTTVCDMPNTIPPTVTIEALRDKVERAEKISDCDIRFFFGATEERHLQEFERLFTDPSLAELRRRCCGLKLYLDHSTGDQKASDGVLKKAFALCAALDQVAVCHCEDSATNEDAKKRLAEAKSIDAYSLMRPPQSEEKSVAYAIELARKTGAKLHIAHLSTKGGAERVKQAKASGVRVTCEVAPHHLFLTTDDYASLGARAKMNPPLRTVEHRDALWAAIADGTIDCIATDHAPHTLTEKNIDDPLQAPSGVPGVETMLPLLLTVASGGWPNPRSSLPTVHGSLSHSDITRLCFENPNRIFALEKTSANAGKVTVNLDVPWTIRAKNLHSKCGWTPYEGWDVIGKITLAP